MSGKCKLSQHEIPITQPIQLAQIKAILLTPKSGKDVQQQKQSFTADGNANGETTLEDRVATTKLNTQLP